MKRGIGLALLTAVISGFSVFANGRFVTQGDPIVFAFIRNLVVALALTVLVLATGYRVRLSRIARSDWWRLFAIGCIGGGIPFGLFFLGLSHIGPVGANVINKSLFLWVAVLAVPLLHEKLHWFSLIGYGVLMYALFGMAALPAAGPFSLIILAATVLWAVEHVIAKTVLPRVPPVLVAWARILFGLPPLFVFVVLATPGLSVTPDVLQASFVSALLLIGYMTAWYSAMKYAPVSLVASVLILAPVVTNILNSGLLGKPFPPAQLTNALMLFLGVGILIAASVLRIRRSGNAI